MTTDDANVRDGLDLAVTSYETVDPTSEGRDVLNLAWTRDERECLAVDLESVVSSELRAELDSDLEYVHSYFVRDPYGETLLRPAVAAFFGNNAWQGAVTCGAGVVSLVHALARLTNGKAAHIIGDTYPDFPYWVEQSGGVCAAQPSSASVDDLGAESRRAGAAVLFLERPGLFSDAFAELTRLEALCREAAANDALVIVDESNANYCPPQRSAVVLAGTLPNLIVARGFSKAYGLGGLRLAYCVSAPALTERVRSAVPPLLASSLSLRLGKRILELGDVAAPLRSRIRERKREMIERFERANIEQLVPSTEFLPYVFVRNRPDYLRSHLEDRGIVGKPHPMWSERSGTIEHLYRLSVPLNATRMQWLNAALNT